MGNMLLAIKEEDEKAPDLAIEGIIAAQWKLPARTHLTAIEVMGDLGYSLETISRYHHRVNRKLCEAYRQRNYGVEPMKLRTVDRTSGYKSKQAVFLKDARWVWAVVEVAVGCPPQHKETKLTYPNMDN